MPAKKTIEKVSPGRCPHRGRRPKAVAIGPDVVCAEPKKGPRVSGKKRAKKPIPAKPAAPAPAAAGPRVSRRRHAKKPIPAIISGPSLTVTGPRLIPREPSIPLETVKRYDVFEGLLDFGLVLGWALAGLATLCGRMGLAFLAYTAAALATTVLRCCTRDARNKEAE